MPFDPQGVHTLPSGSIVTIGDNVIPSQHNPPLQDISACLSQVLLRDGRASMTGPLNMNGNAITGIAASSSSSGVATVGQTNPIGCILDYAGLAAPPGWLLCYGQNVSRATFADLFAVIGTLYGAGNGSTTFTIPDLRGRLIAGLDNMGGVTANRLNAVLASGTIGSAGGVQTHALTAAQLAPHPHSGVTNATLHNHAFQTPEFTTTTTGGGSFGIAVYALTTVPAATASTSISQSFVTDNGSGLSGSSHPNVQPTIVMNKIIRASYNG